MFGGLLDRDDEEPPPSLEQISHLPYTSEEAAKISGLRGEVRRLESEVETLESEVETLEKRLSHLRDKAATDDRQSEKKAQAKSEEKGRTISVDATFYTAGCEGCSGITATGIDVRQTIHHEGRRIIAVDPNVIPLGSIVRVTLANGDEFKAIAGDTGGAIKGSRIDVLVGSKVEARRLGRQSASVEIISKGRSVVCVK